MTLVFVAIVATHLDAIPFWDARNYLHCVEDAVTKRFNLFNFRCFGHPSIVYALLWGLTQYVRPWTPASMYIVNAVVGAASIVAFDGLLRRLFPDRHDVEYSLLTALYALAPLFVSHAIFLNLDYGATALFVIFLYFLLARRYWLASVFGVAASFTKEIAAAACAVAIVADVVAFELRPGTSWPQRAAALRSYGPLLVIPSAVGAYALLGAVFRSEWSWSDSFAPGPLVTNRTDAIWNTNLADPTIRSFLADIFVLNFQWLYSIAILVALCAALIRVAPSAGAPNDLRRRHVFLALSLAGLVYLVTRFRPNNNARYVLLASPILILAFYDALGRLSARAANRLIYLSVCAVLVVLSNFRSLDFVSRSVFGTFPFGSHALVDTTSLIGGLKLDAIVYNLEFLQLQYLYADMVRDVRPRYGSVLLMGNAIYNFPPDVDGRDYTLTSNPTRAVPFFVAIGDVKRDAIASHVRTEGELFYYVAFANADNVQLRELLKKYALVGSKTYSRYGYTLDVHTFRWSFTS